MEEKDREIWIGENRMYLGEDNILHVTLVGEVNNKIAIAMKETDLKFKSMVEEKVDVLADLSKARKPTPEARRIWREMSEHDKTGKIAMFGMHPVARVLASFVMGISNKKDMRFFKIKEEAQAWLKE